MIGETAQVGVVGLETQSVLPLITARSTPSSISSMGADDAVAHHEAVAEHHERAKTRVSIRMILVASLRRRWMGVRLASTA